MAEEGYPASRLHAINIPRALAFCTALSQGDVQERRCAPFLEGVSELLICYHPDGRLSGINHIAPRLVTRWQESPDGLTYDFELRQGVKFHHGDAFTAEDVKFSFECDKGTSAGDLK